MEDLGNSTVSVDGLVIGIPGSGPANLMFDTNMTNFTIKPGPGNHRIIEDNGVANDGISRAFNASDGTYSDFKNPTGTLTVLDTNATGGSNYEYQGLDAVGRPAAVNLDTGGAADIQTISIPGAVGNVVEDLKNSTVTVNGQVIGIPGSGPANLFLNMNMANLTIEPGAGNHRILQDNGTPNDGISRAFNASNGTYTDFKNPTGTLTVKDTNASGGSNYEFQGLNAVGRSAIVNLDTGGTADTQTISIPGKTHNVVENLVNSTVNVNGQMIGIPGSGPANVFLNMAMTNLTIEPGAGNHRIIQDNGTPNDGLSRRFQRQQRHLHRLQEPEQHAGRSRHQRDGRQHLRVSRA